MCASSCIGIFIQWLLNIMLSLVNSCKHPHVHLIVRLNHFSRRVCVSHACMHVCVPPFSPLLCWRLTMPPRVQRRSNLFRWALRLLVTDCENDWWWGGGATKKKRKSIKNKRLVDQVAWLVVVKTIFTLRFFFCCKVNSVSYASYCSFWMLES